MEGSTSNGNAPNGENRRERNGDQRGRGRGRGGGGRGGGRGGSRGRGGNRGGGGKGFASRRGDDKEDRGKRTGDMGRGAYQRLDSDKRRIINESRAKRIEAGAATAGIQYSKEEIESEARKPKKKVAVMIGYAGSGYKGMQINAQEKTIEGDIFKAFVLAGAISKANADDPKKSSLVRCARTDKGVHAAGNVISLKLITGEEEEGGMEGMVEKINKELPPQIRVWGMERTNGSFSCYQSCDSRWYEYLIPTFCFLPPPPESFLGKKLIESAKAEGYDHVYEELQGDCATWWDDVREAHIKPILEKLDPELRKEVMAALHKDQDIGPEGEARTIDENQQARLESSELELGDTPIDQPTSAVKRKAEEEAEEVPPAKRVQETPPIKDEDKTSVHISEDIKAEVASEVTINPEDAAAPAPVYVKPPPTPLEVATKEVKAAYLAAKKAYRISELRRNRVQEALNQYLGTQNFHNYTIQKRYSDPSAKRVIKSFDVGKEPVMVHGTEWLSLKVHGQSFMMHQIRKMIAMVTLVVRCATPISVISETYGPATISIPKAPGLGLLLERPVFATYNERCKREYERDPIDFNKYQAAMDSFKQEQIYDRIFREEERDAQFHAFFHHIDHYRTDYFLWVTAGGLAVAKQSVARREDGPAKGVGSRSKPIFDDSDDEKPDAKGEEG